MEQDVALGTVGTLKLTFVGGIGKVELSATAPGNVGITGGAFVQGDSGIIVDLLFGMLEQHSPAGLVLIEESAKAALKAAIAKL